VAHQRVPQRPADSEAILLSEKEAAKILGFSHRTLQAWRVSGGGPQFIRVSARCVRYRRMDLISWVNDRIRLSTSDTGRNDE
jgi:predicted DNA-binding transcriptional regulator AlpA